MEYTVIFTKYHMKTGKETLFETTICSDDPTALKREVTKMVKAVEPFAKLQKECPLPWCTNGYNTNESYNKTWSGYEQKSPITDYTIYTISVSPTSNALRTASEKVYEAKRKTQEALEALQKKYANDTDLSKIDSRLSEILAVDLPDHITALIGIFEKVAAYIESETTELNEKTE